LNCSAILDRIRKNKYAYNDIETGYAEGNG
jgi:hypothetical protein